MIGWLHGQVLHHQKDGAIVLDVHDVGYEVSVASQERLPRRRRCRPLRLHRGARRRHRALRLPELPGP